MLNKSLLIIYYALFNQISTYDTWDSEIAKDKLGTTQIETNLQLILYNTLSW